MTAHLPRRRTERRGLRLWPVGTVLALTFATAVLVPAAVFYTGWDLLGARGLKPERRLDSTALFDLVKLSFGVVAGAGALVALVVAYWRQRVAFGRSGPVARTALRPGLPPPRRAPPPAPNHAARALAVRPAARLLAGAHEFGFARRTDAKGNAVQHAAQPRRAHDHQEHDDANARTSRNPLQPAALRASP